jgi:hypothetical protein
LRGKQSRCSASKKYLAGLWGNSDFEPSEESMPKMGPAQRLAKTAKKRVCPENGQFFLMNPKRG